MAINEQAYTSLKQVLSPKKVVLVAVSKVKPVSDIQELYELGQRDFGENYVQELVDKQAQLPKDIRWHFIGHLQSNKVKYIASFIYLIHGVDSLSLLREINKQAAKHNRIINCLFQIYIAKENTKFGMDETKIKALLEEADALKHVQIKGLMGMASFSDDEQLVRNEFKKLKICFDEFIKAKHFSDPVLSMGMSGDYEMAIEEGSNMVRIGSLLFGTRS